MEEDRPSSDLSFRAEELVKNALERACQAVANEPGDKFTKYEMRNIDWVPRKDFTVELGKKQIAEYIRTSWEVSPSWLFNLEFLGAEEEEHRRTSFRYRARWSVPTSRTPIPKGTASVYFTVDVSEFKPETSPVDVSFAVESHKLLHVAGRTRFREKWLRDVIDSKALLHATVDF